MVTENMVQVVSLSVYLYFSTLSRYSNAAKVENVGCFTLIFLWLTVCCVVACWERDDLLALVGDVCCIFVTFTCGVLGRARY